MDAAGLGGGVRRFLRRFRVPLVVLPLLAGLVVAGGVGASLLWAAVPKPASQGQFDVCWSGETRPGGTCTAPHGTRGLVYLFPGFHPTDPGCHQRPTDADDSGKATEWRCTSLLRGHRIEIAYRSRTAFERGIRYLTTRYADAEQEISADGGRYVWRTDGPDRSGRYEFVSAYLDYPYTLTLWAATPQLRDEATRALVRFRDVADVTLRRHVEERATP